MKHLFFVAVAGIIFSVTSISVKAQTSANIERFAGRGQPKNPLKFIEGIEIVPAAATNIASAATEGTTLNPSAPIIPLVVKTGLTSTIELCSPLQFKYAMMTGREVESITNILLYNFIDAWWATRYKYGGTNRSGIDCSSFTGKILLGVYGLAVPRTAKDQYNVCEKLAMVGLAEGDLVFFNIRGGISHVGLYLGNNYFVHSSVHDGVTISSLTDEFYRKKFISGGRIKQPQTLSQNEGDVTKVVLLSAPVFAPATDEEL